MRKQNVAMCCVFTFFTTPPLGQLRVRFLHCSSTSGGNHADWQWPGVSHSSTSGWETCSMITAHQLHLAFLLGLGHPDDSTPLNAMLYHNSNHPKIRLRPRSLWTLARAAESLLVALRFTWVPWWFWLDADGMLLHCDGDSDGTAVIVAFPLQKRPAVAVTNNLQVKNLIPLDLQKKVSFEDGWINVNVPSPMGMRQNMPNPGALVFGPSNWYVTTFWRSDYVVLFGCVWKSGIHHVPSTG